MREMRLRTLADHIEKHAALFDYSEFCTQEPECDTLHCIAGFAVKLFRPDLYQQFTDPKRSILPHWSQSAISILGLEPEQSEAIFVPWNWAATLHSKGGENYPIIETMKLDRKFYKAQLNWARGLPETFEFTADHAVAAIRSLINNGLVPDWYHIFTVPAAPATA